ncbi:response regulator [Sphingomonas adhaesiva]|uniref:response regulator n=1 Tax=Sphingomonas adhaesiva TaxID=28212 RepID=UPI002FFD301A
MTGKRILIVEDEYFIASDLKRALGDQDAVVLGPVGSLDAGLAAVAAAEPIDLAVLDVNLDGAESYPIADRLAELGVPFMFVTGYDDWAMPRAYRDTPRLAKPFPPGAVVRAIERLVAAPEKQ